MAPLKPFESVLIANRGEIAVRVARTCRELGIRSIAIYSDADAGALFTKECDEAISIGGVAPSESYLRSERIIQAAQRAGAEAIHPGYGFLSENASFAAACAQAGLTFVGPPPDAMHAVGDKILAKKTATQVGVPVVPGYSGDDQSLETLKAQARQIGVPLLIKAAAGGGGRGMRLVNAFTEFEEALAGARREAQAAFGDATVFLERYVMRPRHIEIQVLADNFGSVAAFVERECSIQRRYQKILEESPSTAVDPPLRATLQEAATKIARAVEYRNAGTLEFMLDEAGTFYFLEMNARLQVEHPVTEMVTGTDLVREQLWIAAGRPLSLAKGDVGDWQVASSPQGHAIEVRIYAEDTASGFLPSTGEITVFRPPTLPGVRNDVAVEAGSIVSPAYDSMIAKLISHAHTRPECIRLMSQALGDYVVGGVATNVGFLQWLVAQPDFVAGQTTTDFLESHGLAASTFTKRKDDRLAALAGAGALASLPSRAATPKTASLRSLGAWRHSSSPRVTRFVDPPAVIADHWLYEKSGWRCSGEQREVQVQSLGEGVFALESEKGLSRFAAWRTPDGVAVSMHGEVTKLALAPPPSAAADGGGRRGAEAVTGSVQAPMSGTIVKVNVKPNDTVNGFTVLAVMEAMKMEHTIVAPYAGTVTAVKVQAGQTVGAGETLVLIKEG